MVMAFGFKNIAKLVLSRINIFNQSKDWTHYINNHLQKLNLLLYGRQDFKFLLYASREIDYNESGNGEGR